MNSEEAMRIFYAVVNVIICILGVAGNGLVIWITGFKVKKSVVTTWYLSLATADFLFCSFLPFSVIYVVKDEWISGHMCKLVFFNMFFNWFTSIFLLVIISVDRCVVVLFPVWAQNHRTIRKALVIAALAWITSAMYCLPSAISLSVQRDDWRTKFFFYNYTDDLEHTADVACDFAVGFLIPFVVVVFCYIAVMQKLKSMTRFKKAFKIMTVLIATFFTCWLPYHIFAFMELNYTRYNSLFFNSGYMVALSLANANSCLNPFLYAFMGKDVKKQCHALLMKIENAVEEEEEGQCTVRMTVTTNSMDSKLSSTV